MANSFASEASVISYLESPREDGKRRMEREGFDIATRLSIVSQPCVSIFLSLFIYRTGSSILSTKTELLMG